VATTTGKVYSTIPEGFKPGTYALDSDGNILIAGRVTSWESGQAIVQRYKPTGAQDLTFGTGDRWSLYGSALRFGNTLGRDSTDAGGLRVETDVQVLQQPDGKILVLAGEENYYGNTMTLQRFTSSGSPDNSMLGMPTQLTLPGGVNPTGLALQADGKILVLGYGRADPGQGTDTFLWRFNADGTPDQAFGSGGKLQTNFGGTGDWSPDAAVQVLPQADGSMILFGAHIAQQGLELAMLRIASDGTPDIAGATPLVMPLPLAGPMPPALPKEILQQDNGRWLMAATVAGPEGDQAMVMRFDANGLPDRTFGLAGHVVLPGAQHARDVVQLADGRIVVGFDAGNAFGVAVLDHQGYVLQTQSIDVGANATLDQLLVQADGKLLLAGQAVVPGAMGAPDLPQLAMVRLQSDLSLDTGYFSAVESDYDIYLTPREQNLRLTGWQSSSGTGNEQDNLLFGNGGNNRLMGREGNDVLDGGAGQDYMDGGAGDDVYYVDNEYDQVSDFEGGHDVVHSTADVNFMLGEGVEDLLLEGTARYGSGNQLANRLVGNEQSNILRGHGGDDVIDGGAGADEMDGGQGNDIYHVDNEYDRVREDVWLDPDGYDTVYASVNFRLEQGVEKLVLTQSYTRGTGNELANVLASQADYTELEGGDGNDTYLVASDTVRVNEWYGNAEDNRAGIDRVISTAEYYGLSPNVEILELAGTAIGGRGNEGDNTLIGNSQDNFLQGAGGNDLLQGGAGADVLSGDDGNDTLDGGAGADRMEGGYGDDLYIVDDSGDKIQDFGGVDTVRSSATSFWMGDGVENLVLEGGALEGIGNWLDNKIVGSAGDNMLYGEEGNDVLEGGAGNDQLRGGTGADRFVIGADSEGGRDIVFDFKAGEGDVIDLSGLDADPLQDGDQAFVVVEAFTANATGQVYFFNGSLYISTDAEPDADLVIELFGITAMPQEGVLL
jgi:uncharacterized delta-60 repeat protein